VLIDDLGRKVERRGTWLAVGVVVLSLAAQAYSLREPPNVVGAWKASLFLPGRPDRAAMLAARFNPSFNAARFVSTRLPENARLLMVGETLPFYYGRELVAPSAFDAHPLQGIALPGRDPREILRELRAMGFTHVLVNWPEWRRFGDTYYRTQWPKEDRIAVERFLGGLPAVYVDGVVSIYNLGGPVQ
jgi:hypothetical protein